MTDVYFKQNTFFSNAHGTFSKIDHMIGHKTSLNKFKKEEIISSIFSDHKGLKVETNLNEKTQKHSNSWRLNSMLLNNECIKNEIKGEIKVSGNKWEWTHNNPKLMGHSEGSPEREVHSNTGLPKKDRNISNKQPNPTHVRTQGTTTKTAWASRMKEITKIRAELNDIETKSTILRINKSRNWFFEKIKKINKPLSTLIKKKRGSK